MEGEGIIQVSAPPKIFKQNKENKLKRSKYIKWVY
jgi:hypothetical protein